MDAMFRRSGNYAIGMQGNRLSPWMIFFSILVHAVAFFLGSFTASMFPTVAHIPVVTIDLMEPLPSELLEEAPPLPPRETIPSVPEPTPAKVAPRQKAQRAPSEQRWLKKLDASLARVPEAFVTRKEGRTGGIAVRHWENRADPRPGDFAPAVAPEVREEQRKQMADLEDRVLRSGKTGLGSGETAEAMVVFRGAGRQGGDSIPPWVREMIRAKVRGYLPQLEAGYSTAIRRNPKLKGKLMVRFRIDPTGRIRFVEPVESSVTDGAFVTAVLEKVRGWTFDPIPGRTVEVLYPLVFVPPPL